MLIKMSIFIKKIALVIGCLICLPVCSAADFSVGRVTVQLPGDGWRAVQLQDLGINFSGEILGTIASEKKAFIKESFAKNFQAVVLVRASSGGIWGGTMEYVGDCTTTDEWVGVGTQQSDTAFYECLRVFKVFTSQSVINVLSPELKDALKKDNVVLTDDIQAFSSRYANSNGTFLDVRAFLAPNFVGKQGVATASLPVGINVDSYLWGLELSKAVKSSVNSIFGKFVVPSIEFKPVEKKSAIAVAKIAN